MARIYFFDEKFFQYLIFDIILDHVENFTFENSNYDPKNLAYAFYQGLFAYNGWNYLNFIIEELKDPVRYYILYKIYTCDEYRGKW